MDMIMLGKLFQKANWKAAIENKLENLYEAS